MREKILNTILILLIGIFVGCSKSHERADHHNNGINSQILNIVDSIPLHRIDKPFITISFTACNDSIFVIRFFNSVLIPVDHDSISESNSFVGLKKYMNIYLVFWEDYPTGNLEKFVIKDSLQYEEEPFIRYKVYEFYERYRNDNKFIEKKYLINANDSLILYEGKCLFDLE